MNKPVYALSIKQPWAWLICKGYKDIENRDWRIGRKRGYHDTNFEIELPCRVYIHASKVGDYSWDVEDFIMRNLNDLQKEEYLKVCGEEVLGAIIGAATITDCVSKSNSPWFVGRYGFVFRDPVLYSQPIPCRGQLGFFKPNLTEAK
ncbi:MAG: hypothetical protein PHU23_17635 [Dehalococcoidales bacterium]|nr:hypothetical protein [Dehalococcoidales bacterium]